MRNDLVYLLKARVIGPYGLPVTLHKIGLTDRSPADRVREVRETGGPSCRVVAYTKKGDAKAEEARLHQRYKDKRWRFRRKFSGHTEFFRLSNAEAREVARWMGMGFELTLADECFMWALLALFFRAIFL